MKKLLFIAAALIAALAAGANREPAEGSCVLELTLPESSEAELCLVSYNVGVFNKYIRGSYRMVADMMAEAGADAVCMNELDSCAGRTDRVFQLERIAALMGGWDYAFGAAMPFDGGSYGSGIMGKGRILKKFNVALPQGAGSEPRTMAVAEFENYVLATTHLDYVSEDVRADQVKVINDVMESIYRGTKKPVFLCGDMNAEPASNTIRELCRAWVILSPTDHGTFTSDSPSECIDYIMMLKCGARCEVADARVLDSFRSADAAKASDHLPVMVRVRLPENGVAEN